jgi:hypothetical protein
MMSNSINEVLAKPLALRRTGFAIAATRSLVEYFFRRLHVPFDPNVQGNGYSNQGQCTQHYNCKQHLYQHSNLAYQITERIR